MRNVGFSSHGRMQSGFPEDLQHRGVFRQDLRDQFLQAGIPGDRGKMTHHCGTDPLSLVFVDQGESYLARPGSTTM
jgi:hypothetical protein